jgi:hypothetical protein
VLSRIKTIDRNKPVARLSSITFTPPTEISVESATLSKRLVEVGDGELDCVALADGDAEALGIADGFAEALGLADGDGFGLALFTGTGTPLPQTNLPLFLMQVNF